MARGRARKLAAGAALFGAGGLLYAREVEPRRLEVVRLGLTLPRLAAPFDGYRVVQIGGLHLDDWSKPAHLSRVSDLVNAERPDLIVVTGDFASYSAKRLDTGRLVGALGRLWAPDGVLAILGYHDYLTDVGLIRACIREAGLTGLLNEAVTLGRGGSELHVAGIDDVMEGRSRLDLVLRKLPEGGRRSCSPTSPTSRMSPPRPGASTCSSRDIRTADRCGFRCWERRSCRPSRSVTPAVYTRSGGCLFTPTGGSGPSTRGCGSGVGRRSRF